MYTISRLFITLVERQWWNRHAVVEGCSQRSSSKNPVDLKLGSIIGRSFKNMYSKLHPSSNESTSSGMAHSYTVIRNDEIAPSVGCHGPADSTLEDSFQDSTDLTTILNAPWSSGNNMLHSPANGQLTNLWPSFLTLLASHFQNSPGGKQPLILILREHALRSYLVLWSMPMAVLQPSQYLVHACPISLYVSFFYCFCFCFCFCFFVFFCFFFFNFILFLNFT